MKFFLLFFIIAVISCNGYHRRMLQPVTFSKLGDDKMLSCDWSTFNIPEDETIYLIKVELFSFSDKLGFWKGAIGTTTTEAPDYLYITEDMSEIFTSNEGLISWNVPEEIGKIIPKGKGQLKFGIWEIGLDSFYIKSLYVETIHNK